MLRYPESRGKYDTPRRVSLAAGSLLSLAGVIAYEQPLQSATVQPKTQYSPKAPPDMRLLEISHFNQEVLLVSQQEKPATTTTTTTTAPSPVTPVNTAQPTGILRSIAGCESGGSPDAPINYQAQNPTSTASGAFQVLDTTWNNFDGYSEAKFAPPAVQLKEAEELYDTEGTSPWVSSEACWN